MRGIAHETGPYRNPCLAVIFRQVNEWPGEEASVHPLVRLVLNAVRAALPAETRCSLSPDGSRLGVTIHHRNGRIRRLSFAASSVVRLEICGEQFGLATGEAIRLRRTWLREVTLWSGPGHRASEARAGAQALADALGVPLFVLAAE